MELEEARRRAEKLMVEHGLDEWRFGFDRGLWRAGFCRYELRLITLSRAITELNTWSAMKDVVLHEIAHALVGKHASAHGREWQAKALEIGAPPTRFIDSVQTPPRKWEATCLCEGRVFKRHQRPADKSRCCRTCRHALVYQRAS